VAAVALPALLDDRVQAISSSPKDPSTMATSVALTRFETVLKAVRMFLIEAARMGDDSTLNTIHLLLPTLDQATFATLLATARTFLRC